MKYTYVTYIAGLYLSLGASTASSAFNPINPELPREYVDTTLVSPTGRTIAVPPGGGVQAAIDQAAPGDVITLQAGATYTGNFTLRNKTGSGWITIRTSTPEGAFKAPGNRVSPADAPQMAKLVTLNSAPVFSTDAAAHHYRLIGLEITVDPSQGSYNLLHFEAPDQTSFSVVPSNLIVDRCYIHGQPNGNFSRRGIGLNSTRSAVIDSYLSDFKDFADAQAILVWNSPGVLKIVNNYLEASGENLYLSGVIGGLPAIVPADIEIRGNYLYKPLKWKIGDPAYAGIAWSVKNSFEIKSARRVLLDGNIFDSNWRHAQNGTSVLFSRNQDSGDWAVIEDITFTNNIVRNSTHAIRMSGGTAGASNFMNRALFRNNVAENIGSAAEPGWLFVLLSGTLNATIEHNTGIHTGIPLYFEYEPSTNAVFRNNIAIYNDSGVVGSGTASGTSTLATYAPPTSTVPDRFVQNVLVNNLNLSNPDTKYPPANYFPVSISQVGFTNAPAGDYTLLPSSPYKGRGTDGKDIGVDMAALRAATANTVTGLGNSIPVPAPGPAPDTAAPVISSVNAVSLNTTSETITWTTDEASDTQVEYGAGAITSSSPLDANRALQHSVTLSGLQPDTLYQYRVRSKDAAGNLAISVVFSFRTPSPADTVPPSVAVTSPGNGQTVSGVITLAATAADNVGVAGVRFMLDGSNTGNEFAAAPYSMLLDTTPMQGCSHTVSAVARDAAGNQRISTPVVFRLTDAFRLSSTALYLTRAGAGTYNVTVSSTRGCSWTAASNASWIRLITAAQVTGSGTVQFRITQNTTGLARSGTLTIAGQMYSVYQPSR